MGESNSNRKYESFKIPGRQQIQEAEETHLLAPAKPAQTNPSDADTGVFYEIEYDCCPIPGVGKFVPKPQKIEASESEKDEIRETFDQMREIARAYRSTFGYSRFFDKRVHTENSIVFYKQALFMKDFTDDYSGSAPFSQYFPYYQMMGYEQLRTYFTWRTKVREGNVSDTSLSYAFLYIYELLSNIGVKDPQNGLDKLMFFWKAFRVYQKSIDRYVLRWLKDYHIYYQLTQSFQEFVQRNHLAEHYPQMTDTDDTFELFCSISNYDIRKSVFFTDDNAKLIIECFYFVVDRLRHILDDNGIHFDQSIFQPAKMSVWTPFKDALFHNWMKQPDRRIVLSPNEIYICTQNQWAFNTTVTSQGSRQLLGYIIKQMESVLRKAVKYKFKLTANVNGVTHKLIAELKGANLSLESIISSAVMEFYREATKTVVKVDQQALSIIRQEALATQQKLIVDEQDETPEPNPKPLDLSLPPHGNTPFMPDDSAAVSGADMWESFKNSLSGAEATALSIVLHGGTDLKQFADSCGVMLEVLMDGINEKAMDFIGDNLIDDEFVLYEDYKNQVKELVG